MLQSSQTANGTGPTAAIIIPVHNGADCLGSCLAALREHAPDQIELIVVDDGSRDHSATVAESFGARLVRVDRRRGPAVARNLGAQVTHADALIFLDADVRVRHETLGELMAPMADESVQAVIGSYDADPPAAHAISRFRNLWHHYVHQTAATEAGTFWAGCGAVRRAVFVQVGGFNTEYSTSSVEDLDLGIRLRQAGQRIVLVKRAQVTHLKRWTFWTMCMTDLWRRAVPWSGLILREGRMPNDLNLKMSQRLSVALTGALLILLGLVLCQHPWIAVLPVLWVLAIQILDTFEIRPMVVTWMAAVTSCVGGLLLWASTDAPAICLLGLAGVFAIWRLNAEYYRWLSRSQGACFALAMFPVHLLYYALCGLGFVIALIGHFCTTAWPRASREQAALSELDLV